MNPAISQLEAFITRLDRDYGVARAAFAEAARRRPGGIVTLRQRTLLLADSRRKR